VPEAQDQRIRRTVLALLAQRAPEHSICPSEVARALEQDPMRWRALMPAVRRIAAALAEEGRIQVTQRAHPVQIEQVSGPVRLHRGSGFDRS